METDRKPPTSAEELLERYAAGDLDFSRTVLPGANLFGANLFCCKLDKAVLKNANLLGVDLTGSSLRGASLPGANLTRASLTDAVLDGADLSGANLSGANLTRASLSGIDLSRAVFTKTVLTDVDLSAVCEHEPLVHLGPSNVDFRTIVRSIRWPNLPRFLVQIGTPEVFVEYMIDCARSLDPAGVFKMLQSTFISYGGPDTDFARKLNDALLKNGVTTFFFAKDAIPGRKVHRLMRDGVNQHDRVILVCSKASLDRPGVLNEIAETLQREARDGGKEYLIPITLDDHVFSGWKPDEPGVAQAIRDRVVADFRGADTDKGVFDAGVLKLIGGLKK